MVFKGRNTDVCINYKKSNKKSLNREIQAHKTMSELEWLSKYIDVKRKIEV